MSRFSLLVMSSTLAVVMPNSSAWMVAMTAQSTRCGPLVVAVEHHRPERLLRERLVEDGEPLGPPSLSGEGRAHAGQLRLVRRLPLALAGDERVLGSQWPRRR